MILEVETPWEGPIYGPGPRNYYTWCLYGRGYALSTIILEVETPWEGPIYGPGPRNYYIWCIYGRRYALSTIMLLHIVTLCLIHLILLIMKIEKHNKYLGISTVLCDSEYLIYFKIGIILTNIRI